MVLARGPKKFFLLRYMHLKGKVQWERHFCFSKGNAPTFLSPLIVSWVLLRWSPKPTPTRSFVWRILWDIDRGEKICSKDTVRKREERECPHFFPFLCVNRYRCFFPLTEPPQDIQFNSLSIASLGEINGAKLEELCWLLKTSKVSHFRLTLVDFGLGYAIDEVQKKYFFLSDSFETYLYAVEFYVNSNGADVGSKNLC
jgi:hypothetical protein